MKKHYSLKLFVVTGMIGFFSPSLTIEKESANSMQEFSFSLLTKAEARGGRGGGGMRGGGMRSGGFSRGSMGSSRSMSSPSNNRYQGGNFSQGSTNSLGFSTDRATNNPQRNQAIKDRRAESGKKVGRKHRSSGDVS